MLRLDLGCGNACRPGYQGVDLSPDVDCRWHVDLEDPVSWPWANESVDAIYTSHYVEHCRDLVGFMNACWRILKPGALMMVRHPYQFSVRAWQDPTHVRALNEMSWSYYDPVWRRQVGVEQMGIRAAFSVEHVGLVLAAPWAAKLGVPYGLVVGWEGLSVELRSCVGSMVNVVDDLVVSLRRHLPSDPPPLAHARVAPARTVPATTERLELA